MKRDDLTSWPPVPSETGAAFLDALAAFERSQLAALKTAESAQQGALSALRRELALTHDQFRQQLQVVFMGGPGDD